MPRELTISTFKGFQDGGQGVDCPEDVLEIAAADRRSGEASIEALQRASCAHGRETWPGDGRDEGRCLVRVQGAVACSAALLKARGATAPADWTGGRMPEIAPMAVTKNTDTPRFRCRVRVRFSWRRGGCGPRVPRDLLGQHQSAAGQRDHPTASSTAATPRRTLPARLVAARRHSLLANALHMRRFCPPALPAQLRVQRTARG